MDHPRYFVELLWPVDPRKPHSPFEWMTIEGPRLTSVDEVIEQISHGHYGLNHGLFYRHDRLDPLGCMVCVTKIEDGQARDVTEDVLIGIGEAAIAAGGDWPDWLANVAPRYRSEWVAAYREHGVPV